MPNAGPEGDAGMKTAQSDCEDPATLLKARGVRPTRLRCALLSMLVETTSHPSIGWILDELARRGHRAPVATVYQNMSALVDSGLVLRFLDSRGVARFDGNVEPHCHLVCTECDRVEDADRYFVIMPKESVAAASECRSWHASADGMYVHGVCPWCK